jgi:aryl-alcohol dehydrogenase-like predicted oxidoreductase
MQLRQLGKSGLWVSELGLGSLTFGGQLSAWDARQVMDQFLHEGGNLIDTANGYQRGAAEEIIGQWLLDGGHRPFMLISSKTYAPEDRTPNHRGLSRHAILYSVEQSLRRLQTDYLDIYAPHYWDQHAPLEEILRALEWLIQQGKVRYIACSNYLSWQLMKALSLQELRGWSPFIAMHGQYSLIERGIERETLPLLAAEGLSLLAWSPLAGGFLSAKHPYGKPLDEKTRLGMEQSLWSPRYRAQALNERGWAIVEEVRLIARETGRQPAQIALQWVLERPQVASVLMGASKIAQIDELLASRTQRLSLHDHTRLEEISAIELGYPGNSSAWAEDIQ